MVLVHGFTQTHASWHHLVPRLLDDGHEVLAVDAPGHGASTPVRTDLPAGADLLAAAGGHAAYVGYSMGGRLCLHLAVAHPHLVDRLVLLGATGGIDDDGERAARRAADDALAAGIERDGVDAFLERWLAQPLFAGLPDDPADRAARAANTAEGLASSLRLAGTGTQAPLWDALDVLRRRATPALILAGGRDTKFQAAAERLAAAIGPSATVAWVPDAGHAAHLEAPAAFAAMVRPFLLADPAPVTGLHHPTP